MLQVARHEIVLRATASARRTLFGAREPARRGIRGDLPAPLVGLRILAADLRNCTAGGIVLVSQVWPLGQVGGSHPIPGSPRGRHTHAVRSSSSLAPQPTRSPCASCAGMALSFTSMGRNGCSADSVRWQIVTLRSLAAAEPRVSSSPASPTNVASTPRRLVPDPKVLAIRSNPLASIYLLTSRVCVKPVLSREA